MFKLPKWLTALFTKPKPEYKHIGSEEQCGFCDHTFEPGDGFNMTSGKYFTRILCDECDGEQHSVITMFQQSAPYRSTKDLERYFAQLDTGEKITL